MIDIVKFIDMFDDIFKKKSSDELYYLLSNNLFYEVYYDELIYLEKIGFQNNYSLFSYYCNFYRNDLYEPIIRVFYDTDYIKFSDAKLNDDFSKDSNNQIIWKFVSNKYVIKSVNNRSNNYYIEQAILKGFKFDNIFYDDFIEDEGFNILYHPVYYRIRDILYTSKYNDSIELILLLKKHNFDFNIIMRFDDDDMNNIKPLNFYDILTLDMNYHININIIEHEIDTIKNNILNNTKKFKKLNILNKYLLNSNIYDIIVNQYKTNLVKNFIITKRHNIIISNIKPELLYPFVLYEINQILNEKLN